MRPPKRKLILDESEEDEEVVEVGLDDEIEEEEDPQEKEDGYLQEEDDEDLQEEEEEEEVTCIEEIEGDELDEEEEECLQEEEEDKDLKKKEDHEDGSSNPYFFGRKSPTLFNSDGIQNHDSYPLSSNPNENQRSPPTVNNQTTTTTTTTTIKPKMPTKRAAENKKYVEVTRSKIRKVMNGSKSERFGEKESGKKCRLWSEDDEIILLKGMIDYHSKKGVDPYANMGEFHKFITKLLHIDVSKDQLISKIRRLKKKYKKNKDPGFLHEQKSFKLSKKIWGVEDDDDVDDGDDEVLEKGEASKAKDKSGQDKFWSLYPNLSESLHLEQFSNYSLPHCGMSFVKERLRSIGSAKAKELEDKWRQLHVAKTMLNMERAKLILEQTNLILNGIE